MFRVEQNTSKRQRSPSLDRVTKKRCQDYLHPDHWIPSEGFWDTLPQIYLTRRALAEHDRRHQQQDRRHQEQNHRGQTHKTAPIWRRSTRQRESAHRKQQLTQQQLAQRKRELSPFYFTGNRRPDPKLQRFARGGGPDLSSIRGTKNVFDTLQTKVNHSLIERMREKRSIATNRSDSGSPAAIRRRWKS